MYIVSKVGIVALAAGVGVGVPYTFWAAQQHDEPRTDDAPVDAPGVAGPSSDEGPPVVLLFPEPFPRAPVQAPQPPVETSRAAPETIEPTPLPTPIIVYVVPGTVPRPAPSLETEPRSQQSSPARCGAVMCSGDQVCCDAACGICVASGESCAGKSCAPHQAPSSGRCGTSTCNDSQVCCNASCGTCAAIGAACSQAPCG
jgi:hypothetical protein